MIYVPERSEPRITRHSRELQRRVEQLVRDYRRENPELTDDEVRSALAQSMRPTDESDGVVPKRRYAAITIAAAAMAAGLVGALANPKNLGGANVGWQIGAVGIALCAVAFALIRQARRR